MSLFDKPTHTLNEQIQLLKKRGLLIENEERARHYLANVSYYRLSAYTRPFYQSQQGEHHFIPGTSFSDVLELYIFDRELRLLLLDAIERLEIALRAQMTNMLAEHYGPSGYTNSDLFNSHYNHNWLIEKTLKEIENSKGTKGERFIKHYRNKYVKGPALPPIWMAMELLSFKEVSTLFSQLRNTKDKQRICKHFGWPDTILFSWFRSLSDLRNICAHHGRVWNREFGSFPMIPKKSSKYWAIIPKTLQNSIQPQRRLYMQFVVIETLMRIACPESQWSVRFVQFLDAHPTPSRISMGFPDDWDKQAFWSPIVKLAREKSE